ncbi:uncharacterized protein LOC135109737 [Scylla paramamosain]|uniref:uncharacterized protein LOC135109737 n=1 Tax=Scylla paramamosain TaxID=85552 RepID=UPI003083C583
MGRVLPPLLLLLLLVALSPGGAPSPILALDCDAADTEVKEGHTRIIKTEDHKKILSNGDMKLFVKAESDFIGVLLDVEESDGTHHTAWFPAEECYPPNGKWQEFRAWAGPTTTGFDLRLRSGTCRKWCESSAASRNPVSLSIVAYGPSKWIVGKPPVGCDVALDVGPRAIRLPTCQEPPSTATTTTTTTICGRPLPVKIIIIVASAAVVVAVTVVIVVVVCLKRNSVRSPTKGRLQPQPAFRNRHQQFANVQGRTPHQDEEGHYYEILPDHTARREVVSRPAQDSKELVYTGVIHDHGVWPRSPAHEPVPSPGGVASPYGHPETPGDKFESHIYSTVL